MVNTNFLRVSVAVALVAVVGCGDGITEPECDRCSEMRIITDRPEYRPGSVIVFTITNRTSDVLRYDWCSVTLSSTVSDEVGYSPARRCGPGAGPADVLARMVVIDPGASLRDSVNIGGAT